MTPPILPLNPPQSTYITLSPQASLKEASFIFETRTQIDQRSNNVAHIDIFSLGNGHPR